MPYIIIGTSDGSAKWGEEATRDNVGGLFQILIQWMGMKVLGQLNRTGVVRVLCCSLSHCWVVGEYFSFAPDIEFYRLLSLFFHDHRPHGHSK